MSSGLPLYVFAKAPVAGRVKTRLVPAVGADGAARLASALLEDTLEALLGVSRAAPVLAVDEAEAFRGRGLPLVEQGAGDLGQRLERVLSRGLKRAPAVVAVGSDTPGFPVPLLEACLTALEHADAVLVPAEDGGFTLLGLRRCPIGVLRGLPWSGPDTLSATERRMRARGLKVVRVGRFYDVDGPADLARLRVELQEGTLQARHTQEVLRTLSVAPWLSVVVPVLDEAQRLEAGLRRLVGLPGVDEVLVVDGGSRDATRAVARAVPGVRLLEAPRGRARQMNVGAAAARGEVLCFLHADVTLPRDAVAHVARAFAQETVVASAFRTRTVDDGGRRSWASVLLPVADLRSRWTHLPYGDQAVAVRRSAFQRVGGFPDQPLLEDVELARRLSALGSLVRLRPKVTVSGRRFLQRPLRTLLFWNSFPALYRLGVRASFLETLYGKVR
jgi:uncharacterized protein